ncbi:unnamed protein product, partial [Mesorhabditis spiculigera]
MSNTYYGGGAQGSYRRTVQPVNNPPGGATLRKPVLTQRPSQITPHKTMTRVMPPMQQAEPPHRALLTGTMPPNTPGMVATSVSPKRMSPVKVGSRSPIKMMMGDEIEQLAPLKPPQVPVLPPEIASHPLIESPPRKDFLPTTAYSNGYGQQPEISLPVREPSPEEESDADSEVSATTAEEDWGDYTTRCWCEMSHNDEYMISCDKCDVWQHMKCVGIPTAKPPKNYLCEQCNPRKMKLTKGQAKDYQQKKLAELTKEKQRKKDRREKRRAEKRKAREEARALKAKKRRRTEQMRPISTAQYKKFTEIKTNEYWDINDLRRRIFNDEIPPPPQPPIPELGFSFTSPLRASRRLSDERMARETSSEEESDSESEVSEISSASEDEKEWSGEYTTSCWCDMGHDDENMIECEKCSTWQHMVCMGLMPDGNNPKGYHCHSCRPRRQRLTKGQAQKKQREYLAEKKKQKELKEMSRKARLAKKQREMEAKERTKQRKRDYIIAVVNDETQEKGMLAVEVLEPNTIVAEYLSRVSLPEECPEREPTPRSTTSSGYKSFEEGQCGSRGDYVAPEVKLVEKPLRSALKKPKPFNVDNSDRMGREEERHRDIPMGEAAQWRGRRAEEARTGGQ